MIAELMGQREQLAEQLKGAGDLEKLRTDAEKKLTQLQANEQLVAMRGQLAAKEAEAEAAKDEATRTKAISDLKLLVKDAMSALEAMRVQHGADAKVRASEDDQVRAAEDAQRSEAANAQIMDMQQKLLQQLASAIAMLAAPRRSRMTIDGETIESMSEPVI